jgi:UDP-glucose:(heptosyl)LPS alpha-1,3-glucosyltransferase|tara:strand:- start:1915 stop:4173 length:2259 start_codon:yes stop_codon:yes gene_type:complete
MKLAFCLYKYFPFGGLQRDFLRITLECQQRGHEIRVYTLLWKGLVPEGFEVIIVPVTAVTNHSRYKKFSQWVEEALRGDPVDGVIGINKMPGLDLYYAGDSCYEEKARTQRSWLYRQLPRYKHFAEYERAVFSRDSKTEVLWISDVQKGFFKRYYDTPDSRMYFLPPGIARDRIDSKNRAEIRREFREEFALAEDDYLVLMVGSGFIKKGLNRALYAVRSLPASIRKKTRFIVIGDDNPASYRRKIFLLGLSKNVQILSGRDAPPFMLGADLLIHPALDECAGIVLLEAIVAGLPVLATDICGYGHYVTEAEAGMLVASPFRQEELNRKLKEMLLSNKRARWQENGRKFAGHANIYTLPQEACSRIEEITFRRCGSAPKRGILAFCLYKYFPFGGLQRDFLRIALECQRRGYGIRVYTLSWQGEIPAGFTVVIVPVNAITNHKRYERFSDWMKVELENHPVDGVIGFNKMPDLDVYYAGDSCYEEKAQTQRNRLYRSIPRYKHFSRYEKAVFRPDSRTEILMISEVQKPFFLKHYNTPKARFHMLPPGISRDRIAPSNARDVGNELRREVGIEDDEHLLLLIGSGFVTKGLDRVLLGMNALTGPIRDKTRLIVIGQDNPNQFIRMANRLGLGKQVNIYMGRDDIPRFLLGADLLVHPAYVENTGTVLLEAIVAGLPVLTTDVCGYAHYVESAGAGKLIASPFIQAEFNHALAEMLTSAEREKWHNNGMNYAAVADIYSMPSRATDLICHVVN